MKSILSICIPTYMRERNIQNLLTTIIPICKKLNIEICISDNHSYDNTESIVIAKQAEYNNINYVKQELNTNSDNFYHAISLSNSEYVWLLGDNDLPSNDLIQDVYEKCTQRKYACIILHEKEVSFNGKELQDIYFNIKRNIEFSSREYNDILKELGCSMHLISNVVIEKKAWDFSLEEYKLFKMYFPNSEHVGIIFRHLQRTVKPSFFIYDKCLTVTSVEYSTFPPGFSAEDNYDKIYGSIRRVRSWYDMFSNFERAFLNLQAFGYSYDAVKQALRRREETDTYLSHSYYLLPLMHLKGESLEDYNILINELHFARKNLWIYINIVLSKLLPAKFCAFSYKIYKKIKK